MCGFKYFKNSQLHMLNYYKQAGWIWVIKGYPVHSASIFSAPCKRSIQAKSILNGTFHGLALLCRASAPLTTTGKNILRVGLLLSSQMDIHPVVGRGNADAKLHNKRLAEGTAQPPRNVIEDYCPHMRSLEQEREYEAMSMGIFQRGKT